MWRREEEDEREEREREVGSEGSCTFIDSISFSGFHHVAYIVQRLVAVIARVKVKLVLLLEVIHVQV